MDQELWLKSLFFHGPALLHTVVNDAPLKTQNLSKKQKIYRFIKSKHDVLFKERSSVFQNIELSSFNPLPTELFWDCSPVQRRKLFFKNLERGEILILKVINDSLPENYKLQVLAKYQCCMKLDDLSLVMYLPKLEAELIEDGCLNNYDVIRAAVWSCSIHERKLFVTLSSSILEDSSESVKLGKICVTELPPYVGNIQIQNPCYKAYFHHTPTYKDPNWADQLYDGLGLQRKHFYSFHREWDGKEIPVEESAEKIKDKHNLSLSDHHCSQGLSFYKAKNNTKAFASLNQALALCPKNKKALVARGLVYVAIGNNKKAFCDFDNALQVDFFYEPARRHIVPLLVEYSKEHVQQDNMERAEACLAMALEFDNNNPRIHKEMTDLNEIKEKLKAKHLKKVSSLSSMKKKKKKHHRRKSGSKDRERSVRRKSHSNRLSSSSRSRSRSVSISSSISSKSKSPINKTVHSVVNKVENN